MEKVYFEEIDEQLEVPEWRAVSILFAVFAGLIVVGFMSLLFGVITHVALGNIAY